MAQSSRVLLWIHEFTVWSCTRRRKRVREEEYDSSGDGIVGDVDSCFARSNTGTQRFEDMPSKNGESQLSST